MIQTDFVCHNEKKETPKETKTTSPPKQVADKVTEKEKIYLDIPGAKPKKKNRFNVVKVSL